MNIYQFEAYTCRPEAKTFGTITYKGQPQTGYGDGDNFANLNDQNFSSLPYNKVLRFYVTAKSQKDAIEAIRKHNPGINDVPKPKYGMRNGKWVQVNQTKYWSYTR